jgi:hypothetical protein
VHRSDEVRRIYKWAGIMKKTTIIILIFIAQFSFSQNFEKEKSKLVGYKSFEIKNLDSYKSSWSQINYLINGIINQNEHYFEGKLRSKQYYIYDKFGNEIYEVQTFDSNIGTKNDTIQNNKLTYNSKGFLSQIDYHSGNIEKYSDFTETGKPRLIESFIPKNDSLILWPSKKIIIYDGNGNIEKEMIYVFSYSQENNRTKRDIQIETNHYKYDKFNNIIEIKRENEPNIKFPIIMTGGRPQYEIEKFRYVYNSDGLWTKMFWIVDGKEKLIKKRKLIK